jgi:hypothetical protein
MTKARDLANGGFGLVLMKPSSVVNGTDNGKGTVSFSAATTVSLNDVFSATYNRYLLVVSYTKAGTTGSMNLRLRVSGSDASGSDYKYHFNYGESTVGTYASVAANTATSLRITVDNSTTDIQSTSLTIFDPFAATRTSFIGTQMNYGNTTAGGALAGGHNLNTSYTGFTLFPSNGTMTGSVSIYGFNN